VGEITAGAWVTSAAAVFNKVPLREK